MPTMTLSSSWGTRFYWLGRIGLFGAEAQDGFAEALDFCLADAIDGQQFMRIARTRRGDSVQRSIVQDHERRDTKSLRFRGAPGLEAFGDVGAHALENDGGYVDSGFSLCGRWRGL